MFIEITSKGKKTPYIKVYKYRRLFYRLIWRDIVVHYKQAVLGFLWTLLKPLLSVSMFYILFEKLTRFGNHHPDGNFLSYLFCGFLTWTLFSGFITKSLSLVKGNSALLQKVYFPRIYLPFISLGNLFLDFMIGSSALFIILIIKGNSFYWESLLTPLVFVWAIFSSLGLGLLTSSLSLKYRDVSFLVPFFLQLGFYASPVLFSPNMLMLSSTWQTIYNLNPVIGPIYFFRALFTPEGLSYSLLVTVTPSIIVSLIFLIMGIISFNILSKNFADLG